MPKLLMIQLQVAQYAGTAYLNSALKSAGHEFVLYLGRDIKKIIDAVDREKPDLIGFSCMTAMFKMIAAVARALKDRFPIPIILGGPHPTLFPDCINEPSIDIICRGEGEFAIVDLMNAIQKKAPLTNIQGFWIKSGNHIHKNDLRPLIDPLDDVPLIDWSCYKGTPVEHHPPYAFVIRGCPYSCTYCFNEMTKKLYKGGRYVRHFSVERAVAEVQQALEIFPPSPVLFLSDSFGTDLEWMDRFFDRYSQVTDLPFLIVIRPELATEKCVQILSKYRCFNASIGVESGSERVRRDILNRHYSNQTLLDVAARLTKHRIKFRTFNMIGLPTETEEEVWQTIDINIQMKSDFQRVAIFTPYPGTELTEIAKTHGYLASDFNYEDIPLNVFSESALRNVDRDLIKNQLYFFQTAILFPKRRKFIKKLTHLKPNLFFRLWFYLTYAYLQRGIEGRKWIPYLKYLLSNRDYFT
jgi:anaerobic magnesium-protoporphyrin IX monomethyl ester cyclase